jgi:cytochrome c-type biogenesis protein CcsB
VTETLVSYSLLAVWSAMAIYALAFVAFAWDLAQRASVLPKVAEAASVAAGASVSVEAGGATVADSASGGTVGGGSVSGGSTAGGSTALLEKPRSGRDRPESSKWVRIAMGLTVIAWVLHVSGDIMRGLAAGRVPWANMFEFSLTATAIIVGVFLAVQFWQDLRFLGAYVIGFVVIALGVATVNFYVDVVPLPPALQSAWLVIHVFVASTATGFFGLAAALSIVQLVQSRREHTKGLLRRVPGPEALENLAYRLNLVGFVLWTFTLMAGAIWAERAWGRYWGWDTKEVWTFIIWTIFAGYIHARATRGWRGSRSATLAIIGFSAVIFNFTIVNLFFKGLHAYSGL